jgi:hypothetical protein
MKLEIEKLIKEIDEIEEIKETKWKREMVL